MKMIINKINLLLVLIKDTFLNLFSRDKIVLITDKANWSIQEDCENIKYFLKDTISIRISITPVGLKNKIIHFVSINTFLRNNSIKFKIHKSNKVILTWYHITQTQEELLSIVPDIMKFVSCIQVSTSITRQILEKAGVPKDKIVLIPIGVDNRIFDITIDTEKEKNKLGIPLDSVVIGSFQKDGVGWGYGLKPKVIKGPDILCDALEKISHEIKLFVVLTGPARGYVKDRLKKLNIPFCHVFLDNYFELPKYYKLLDYYIISSRVEGGPKALLESMASGVPVVCTEVGMVPDIVVDNVNAIKVKVDDVDSIAKSIISLSGNNDLKNKIKKAGLETAKKFDLNETIYMYFEKIYKNMV